MEALFDIGAAPPCPAPFNLAEHVLAGGAGHGEKPALEIIGAPRRVAMTHGALARAVRATASGLRAAGLAPGQRLLMRLGNSVRFPLTFLGAIHAGIVPVPTSPMLTRAEIDRVAETLGADALAFEPGIVLPTRPPALRIDAAALDRFRHLPAAPPQMGDPDRPAYVIFTSGTSGRARGVVHAHRAIWARRMMRDDWYGLGRNDRLLHAGAFNWSYTLGTGLLDPWACGATALIPAPGLESGEIFALLKRHRATILAATPGVLRQMLHGTVGRAPHLRHALSAGEKLPESIRDAWRSRTGTDIHEAFGMSECSTFISASPARPAPPGTVGYPQTGRRVAILSDEHPCDGAPIEARIAARGQPGVIAIDRGDPGLMLGYLEDGGRRISMPESCIAGNWFVTADRGSMDESGAITCLGRRDDVITAGGYRVSPLEIEAALLAHPAISECAAFEYRVRPDTTIIALAYCAARQIDSAALARHAAARLARYKQPRLFRRLDALPRSAIGKVMRRALPEIIRAQGPERGHADGPADSPADGQGDAPGQAPGQGDAPGQAPGPGPEGR